MIVYVDTSVVMKLLIEEDGTAGAQSIWSSAQHLTSVVLVEVEARAALAAAHRARWLTRRQHETAKDGLASLIGAVARTPISASLVDEAASLAEEEGLRGYDAVHLAAAIQGADAMATADRALGEAGLRRGLHLADPLRG